MADPTAAPLTGFPTEAAQSPHRRVEYRIDRTLRLRNDNRPGVLGEVAGAIGAVGGNIGDIRTVQRGSAHVVRDLDVTCVDLAMLDQVLQAVRALAHTRLVDVRDEVLRVHVGGKLRIVPRYPVASLADLRRVYTPGVAEVCRLIAREPAAADRYTMSANLVAVVTDGTAVLGLGNIGPVAGMPVMEGKCALLAQLVQVDAVPILLEPGPPAALVDAVARIAPTFGAIQLEDIAAPACFTIAPRLQERVPIPVLHDDQHGTATVVLAAVTRAAQLVGRPLQSMRAGVAGLGAAGFAIAELLTQVLEQPVLGAGRTADSIARLARAGGVPVTLDELVARCDIVIAVTAQPELIAPAQVRPGQLIFALSNPVPEILPELARAAGAAIAVDGSVVNNLLGFPGLFRGALDTRARRFSHGMFLAAAASIAALAKGDELVPDPLDPSVHRAVARAVASAAVASDVARVVPPADYFELGPLDRGAPGA
ncbi:MAG TPA: malic enzyme-like NAD(P)-binding protein [Candidatus Micrarchaeia archaeon]|nr:malic enzyme-like NAD(P)-binding protein [Candidatus Micrarchaeia archaeon]